MQNEEIGTPQKYGIPHSFWRKEQKDAFLKCRDIYNEGGGNVVIEAPVGIGKSGISTALGSIDRVTVTVSNHGLINQYSEKYGFQPIYGKQSYPCILKEKVAIWKSKHGISPTASDCHFEKMEECEVAHLCPYLEAKQLAIQSKRMVCTYKYAYLSEAVQARAGILVFDEAHNSVEDLLDIISTEITESEKEEYDFDDFPLFGYGNSGKGDLLDSESRSMISDWLVNQTYKVATVDLFDEMSYSSSKNKKMYGRIQDAISIVSSSSDVFYYCNVDETTNWRSKKTKQYPKMVLKTLDVKRGVYKIIGPKVMSVFMSATIGVPHPLMGSLGISDWSFFTYPHPIPIDRRPIYDLGVDKMTYRNTNDNPGLFGQQANAISGFIKNLDPSWRGIVLAPSNYKVGVLRKLLGEQLNGRVLVPVENSGLLKRIDEFVSNKDEGVISVDTIQGWGSGLSLDGDVARFVVVAGVPYFNPSNRFDAIRMETKTGGAYSRWKPMCDVAQATGRVTRGEKEKDGSFVLNVSALADGSCLTPQSKSQYPRWFNEAIVRS